MSLQREAWMLEPPKRAPGEARPTTSATTSSTSSSVGPPRPSAATSSSSSSSSKLGSAYAAGLTYLKPGSATSTTSSTATTKVGDGGASWRRMLDRNRQEQQKERRRSPSPDASSSSRKRRFSDRGDDERNHDSERPQVRARTTSSTAAAAAERQRAPQVFPNVVPTPSPPAPAPVRPENQIAADLMRAQLAGNTQRERELQAELDRARNPRRNGHGNNDEEDTREVSVARLDTAGRPLVAPRQPNHDARVSRRNRFEDRDGSANSQTFNDKHDTSSKRDVTGMRKSGDRSRWFADDDAYEGIDDLRAHERASGASTRDMDRRAADAIASSRSYAVRSTDDQFDDDAGMVRTAEGGRSQGQSRDGRSAVEREDARQQQRAIAAHKSAERNHSSCWCCLDSPRCDKSLVIAYGTSAYLALPKRGVLTEGHCFVVPGDHLSAINQAGEDTWEEIRNFRKCLVACFAERGLECVFVETALGGATVGAGGKYHTYLECVPIPRADATMAPGYFKKAIMESTGSEWSQHKKLIPMSGPRPDIRKTVPEGFAYFSVEFGMTSGMAHQIEDTTRGGFQRDFAKSVFAGILEKDELELRMQNNDERPEVRKQRIARFSKLFAPFDWTKQLKDS